MSAPFDPRTVPYAQQLRDGERLHAVRMAWSRLLSWEADYTAHLVQQQGPLRPEQSSVLAVVFHRVVGSAGG